MPTQNTCGVFLAKRTTDKTVFKVLHSSKVFSTNKTVWIWRSGVLLCQQTDIGHAQAMPSISFFFLTTPLILHPRRFILLCQQTDINNIVMCHAQAMPSISFFFLTTTLILHPHPPPPQSLLPQISHPPPFPQLGRCQAS